MAAAADFPLLALTPPQQLLATAAMAWTDPQSSLRLAIAGGLLAVVVAVAGLHLHSVQAVKVVEEMAGLLALDLAPGITATQTLAVVVVAVEVVQLTWHKQAAMAVPAL